MTKSEINIARASLSYKARMETGTNLTFFVLHQQQQ